MVGIFVLYYFMFHKVYILYSQKLDRFYTGETADLDIRLEFYRDSPIYKFTGKAKD